MKAKSKFSPRERVMAFEGSDGRTQQHFQAECDINNILAKYRKTGIIEHVNRAQEKFGDFTQYGDLATDMDKVAKAQQSFEMLPAALRNEFKNSIPDFFKFVQDPKNKDKCIELGIFKKPEAPKLDPVVEELKAISKNIAPKKKTVVSDD